MPMITPFRLAYRADWMPECGDQVVRSADGNHIVWEGTAYD
jgi:hypothetical protein